MANRQYIGARYVPKFFENPNGSAEWVEGIPYEALTIVTYLNNSYTSKVPVPATAGSPNVDTQYWVPTGNYNAQVEEYREAVENVSTDLQNTKQTLANVEKQVNEIDDRNKKYLFLTDSYGNHTNENNENFIQVALDNLGITSSSQVFWQGSIGFGTTPNSFLSLLQGNETSINKEEITDIYVLGGANDQTVNSSDIKAGLKSFCNYVTANYPNASIYVGYVTQTFENTTYMINRKFVLDNYISCVNYGASYLKNSEFIVGCLNMLKTDKVHPNSNGVNEIGKYVTQLIKTKSCDVFRTINPNITGLSPNGNVVSSNITMVQHNELCAIKNSKAGGWGQFKLENATTISYENDILSFNIDDCLLFPNLQYGVAINVILSCNDSVKYSMGILYFTYYTDNMVKCKLIGYSNESLQESTIGINGNFCTSSF